MLIYKIFRADEWAALQADGETLGAPIDLKDGYIHFSTEATVRETAQKHFAGANDLMLSAIEADAIASDLKWEESRGGALFPHLYRALKLSEVIWTVPLAAKGDNFTFPEGIA